LRQSSGELRNRLVDKVFSKEIRQKRTVSHNERTGDLLSAALPGITELIIRHISNSEIATAHRRSIVKNEHAIMNNQKETEGTRDSHLHSSESQKKESGGKREEKEKIKQRQVSHSAGAGKNR
jgi:hypothetical protein